MRFISLGSRCNPPPLFARTDLRAVVQNVEAKGTHSCQILVRAIGPNLQPWRYPKAGTPRIRWNGNVTVTWIVLRLVAD